MSVPSSRLSSGVVVVRRSGGGLLFLLLRAFQHWDFPKGMVEEGETPWEAAVREVEEETCLCDLDFAWGNDFVETGPYSRGKTARYYIALTETHSIELPVNPAIGQPEHSEFRWVDYDEALSLTSRRVQPVVTWAANIVRA